MDAAVNSWEICQRRRDGDARADAHTNRACAVVASALSGLWHEPRAASKDARGVAVDVCLDGAISKTAHRVLAGRRCAYCRASACGPIAADRTATRGTPERRAAFAAGADAF